MERYVFPGVVLRQPQPGVVKALCLRNGVIHDRRALRFRYVPVGFHAANRVALRLGPLWNGFKLAAHRAHVVWRNVLIDRIALLCYIDIRST